MKKTDEIPEAVKLESLDPEEIEEVLSRVERRLDSVRLRKEDVLSGVAWSRMQRDHIGDMETAQADIAVENADPDNLNSNLRKASDDEKAALVALAKARQKRAEGVAIQDGWDRFIPAYQGLIRRVQSGITILQQARQLEGVHRAKLFEIYGAEGGGNAVNHPANGPANHIILSRQRIPLFEEALAAVKNELKEHVATMRGYLKKHNLPAHLGDDLPTFD